MVNMYRCLGIFLALLSLFSCKSHPEKVTYFEGILIYETDDRMLDNVPVDSGKFIKYFVKGDSVRVESFTAMGKQIHLRDNSTKSGALIFVFAGKKVALLQDFSKDTLKRGFEINPLKGSEKIAGVYSEKLAISGAHLDKPIEVSFAPHYPNHILDIYDRIIPGLPTKYQLIVQHIPVNYTLVKLESKPVDPQKFSIPNDCIKLSMDEFLQLLADQEIHQ